MTLVRTQYGLGPLVALGLLSCVLLLASSEIGAAGTFRVVNVPPGDELNVRSGPAVTFAIVGTLARDTTGVESLGDCIRRWCPVRDGFVLGWAHANFLERETAGPSPAAGSAAVGTVLADGTLERTLPDGRRVRRLPNGNLQTVWPDGRVSVSTFVQAPGASLPALTPELSGWVGTASQDLLTVLGNILSDDEMTAYLQTEAGKDLIQVFDWRVRSIRFLTTPPS